MNNEQYQLNCDLARMLKGGVIMDVTTPEQAKIAEDAKIADIREMQQKLTSIIRQEATEEVPMVVNCGEWSEVQTVEKTASIKDVINAIEKLGKMQGAFTDKVSLEIAPVVIKDDVNESD